MQSFKNKQTTNPQARKGLLSFGVCKAWQKFKKKGKKVYVLKYVVWNV